MERGKPPFWFWSESHSDSTTNFKGDFVAGEVGMQKDKEWRRDIPTRIEANYGTNGMTFFLI
jgi:hypothetical protein